MAINRQSNRITIENLMRKAKDLSYTIQGELFDARIIPNLCQQFNCNAQLYQWTNLFDLIECLNSHDICLIPYDSDANHEPCLKRGHRAHWLVAHGYLKEMNSLTRENDLILIHHGKSRLLAAFCLNDIFQSNNQLIEVDPKRRNQTEYCLPPNACLRETLTNVFIAIRLNSR